MLDVLTALQQAAPAPSLEWPWWYTLLVGLGTFGAAQVWPVVADRIKREEIASERAAKAEERQAKAMEQQTKIYEQIRLYMETQDFRWAAVESHFSRREKIVPGGRRRLEGERE